MSRLSQDRERKLGWNQWKGTEKLVRDREKFEIERVTTDTRHVKTYFSLFYKGITPFYNVYIRLVHGQYCITNKQDKL